MVERYTQGDWHDLISSMSFEISDKKLQDGFWSLAISLFEINYKVIQNYHARSKLNLFKWNTRYLILIRIPLNFFITTISDYRMLLSEKITAYYYCSVIVFKF